MASPLSGFTVGVTADRRWHEQAEMFRRRGAEVIHGPAIRTVALTDDEGVRAATDQLIARPPDLLIAHTGLGMRTWLAAAEREGRGDRLVGALRRAEVLARGPKAARAVLASGLEVSWRAPTETLAEVVDHVLDRSSVDGVRIALQCDGGRPDRGVDKLRGSGADVVEVPVYRWCPVSDTAPVERLVRATIARRIHALTFTSSPALRAVMVVAEAAGMDDELRAALDGDVAVACVGSVCAASARAEGIASPVVPERARLGSMVAALTDHLVESTRTVEIDGVALEIRGDHITVGGERLVLTEREGLVLRTLASHPDGELAEAELRARCWSGAADRRVVAVTVARLRRRIAVHRLSVSTNDRAEYRLVADR
jgi:uroporphyrinogen-III synthase